MKYRLLDLLQCPQCRGDLRLRGAATRPAEAPGACFPCARSCARGEAVVPPPRERCVACWSEEIVSGTLDCADCGRSFPVVEGVPWLLETDAGAARRLLDDTVGLYGHLWRAVEPAERTGATHADGVEAALGEPIVRGVIGLEAGSGPGTDTVALAGRHPAVELLSVEISEGVYRTRAATAALPNVHPIRASVLALPIRSGCCDFGYSFGVLHHTTDPERGLGEMVRVQRSGAAIVLYLYEDHGDNPWKAVPLRLVTAVRSVTTRLRPRVLSAICYLLSPLIVLTFSIPARILSRFGPTRALADQMPFNFGTSLFSVHGDLLDRFGAPIEVRYSREDVITLLRSCGLTDIRVERLRASAGWVVRGVVPAAS